MQMQTHIGLLYFVTETTVYFDSFGFEHVAEEIKTIVGNKHIKDNIFGVQANDSVM